MFIYSDVDLTIPSKYGWIPNEATGINTLINEMKWNTERSVNSVIGVKPESSSKQPCNNFAVFILSPEAHIVDINDHTLSYIYIRDLSTLRTPKFFDQLLQLETGG